MTTNQTETKSVTAVLVYWELCFTRNCLIRGSSPFLFHQIVLKDENKFTRAAIIGLILMQGTNTFLSS